MPCTLKIKDKLWKPTQLSSLYQTWMHIKKLENNPLHHRLSTEIESVSSTWHICHSSSLILNLGQPLAPMDNGPLPYLELPTLMPRYEGMPFPIPAPSEVADSEEPSHIAFWGWLHTATVITSSKIQRVQRWFRTTSALPNVCCGS